MDVKVLQNSTYLSENIKSEIDIKEEIIDDNFETSSNIFVQDSLVPSEELQMCQEISPQLEIKQEAISEEFVTGFIQDDESSLMVVKMCLALLLRTLPHTRRRKPWDNMEERNDLLKEALGHLTKKDPKKDDASVVAESWATSYRKLPPTQQIYAKKAIEEILVFGQLKLLSLQPSRSCTQSLSSPSYENLLIPGNVEVVFTPMSSNYCQTITFRKWVYLAYNIR